MSASMLSTGRGPVEVVDEGAGEAVLVVHGMPGDWRQGRTLAADLADRWRVLRVSRPGYGRTPLDVGRTAAEQADAYAALLDELGVERAAVVGISGGGPSARAFAAQHRDRCTALVLCCAVAAHLVRLSRPRAAATGLPPLWHAGLALERRRIRRTLADSQRARRLVDTELARDPAAGDAHDDLLAFHRDRALALRGVRGLRNDFRQLHRSGPQHWPAGPRIPTLVLHGDADDVVPLEHGRAHATEIPDARLDVLPGAGHGFLLVRRDESARRIREFLTEAAP